MVSRNGSIPLYIPEGATREVHYNGSSIIVADLRDTRELVPPWYNVVAGEGIVDGRPVLVAIALKRAVYSSSGNTPENICEPIPKSLRGVVEGRMRNYRERRKLDVEIIAVPEVSQI